MSAIKSKVLASIVESLELSSSPNSISVAVGEGNDGRLFYASMSNVSSFSSKTAESDADAIGIILSPDAGVVGAYEDDIKSFFVKLENPYIPGPADSLFSESTPAAFRAGLEAKGYDGIMMPNGSLIAFDAAQLTLSEPENKPSFILDDLFPETMANATTFVEREVVVSSKGDKAIERLGNIDSTGALITSTVQGLENFWETFYGTQAIDEEGRPLLMYHSTNADIVRFEGGRQTTNNYGILGDIETSRAGFFFSPNLGFSQEYLREGHGQNVLPVYLNLQNPLDLRAGVTESVQQELEQAGINIRFVHNAQTYWELFDNDEEGMNDFVEALEAAGYDGAIFPEDSPSGDGEGGVTYVAFRPEQIKSAIGNRGTFDPASPDIRYSRTGQADAHAVQKPITQTEQFKQWFGNSQMIDDNGQPLVVYHGTHADFDSFILPGNKTGRMSGGKAIFFAADPKTSNAFARYEGAKTLPVYLRIEKLFDFGDEATMAKFEKYLRKNFDSVAPGALYGPDAALSMIKSGDYGLLEQPAVISWMKRNGYDGMRLIERQGEVAYAVFKPEQIKSAIGNNGSFDPANPDIRYSFAGFRANTANLTTLRQADNMAKEGMSASLIQRATGWHKGIDGYWRFEISDDKASFHHAEPVDLEKLATQIQPDVEFEASGGLIKAKYKSDTDDYLGAFGRTEDDALRNLAMHITRQSGEAFNIEKVKDGDVFTLDQVLYHPELFAAYPFLSGIAVQFRRDGNSEERGAFYEGHNRIELNADRPPEAILSTLLHEAQHAIQAREDFARGGNSDIAFSESVKNLLQSMSENEASKVEMWKLRNESLLEDARRASELARNALKFESVLRLMSYGGRDKPSGVFRLIRNEMQWIYDQDFRGNHDAIELQRRFYDMPKRGDKRNMYIRDLAYDAAQVIRASIPEEHLEQFIADKRTTKGMINALRRQSDKSREKLKPLREQEAKAISVEHLFNQSRRKSAYDIYRSLAGEVEARTTQARQHLTPEERRNRPVINDMDISPAEAIVIVGGMELRPPFAKDSVILSREAEHAEFKTWFEDSKVVDADGKPKVVYHGSFSDIAGQFRPSDNGSLMGRSIYLTSNPEDASRYASDDSSINFDITGKADRLVKQLGISYQEARDLVTQGNGVVYPLYVDIKNPLVIGKDKLEATQAQFMLAAAEVDVIPEEAERLFKRWSAAKTGIEQFNVLSSHPNIYRGIASLRGHDGIIMRDGLAPTTSELKGNTEHYIAFRSEQVRSAIGKIGDFTMEGQDADLRQNTGAILNKVEVIAMVEGLKKRWNNAPEIQVVQSIDELPWKVYSDAAGLYAKGKVFLIVDNLVNLDHAEFVLLHEVIGHHGLAGVLGDSLDETMLEIYERNPTIRALADVWMSTNQSSNIALATEEALSDVAGKGGDVSGWKKFAATLRKGVKALGFKLQMSDIDVHVLISDSRRWVEKGNTASRLSSLVTRYSRASKTLTGAFRKWFGKSLVCDEKGEPLVVYTGTNHDIEIFRTEGGTGKTYGTGSFFSSNKAVANTYTSGINGGNVMPVYLKLEKPAIFDGKGANWNRLGKSVRVNLPRVVVCDQADEDLLAELTNRESKPGATKVLRARNTTLGRMFPSEFLYDDDFFSTDDLARWARTQGYDGVIFHNVIDHGPSGQFKTDESGKPATIYVCFNPEQIKSAIGNNGDYSLENPNVRYSLAGAMKISEPAQTETEAFNAWFAQSKAVTPDGKPLVVYHGTPNGHFDEFDTAPMFFTDNQEAAMGYASGQLARDNHEDRKPTLMAVYLSMQNPKVYTEAELAALITADEGEIEWGDFDNLAYSLEDEGYDGVIIKGTYDYMGGHGAEKKLGRYDQYVVFRPEQIKSADRNVGTFDPSTPDIRYSRASEHKGDQRQSRDCTMKF